MPLPDILLQFDRLDKNSPQFQDQLTGLLHKEEFKDCIPELRDEDVVWLVEYLDKVRLFLFIALYLHSANLAQALDSLDPSGPTSRKCLRELGSICGTWGKLPPRYLLETSLAIPSTLPVASGGSGDVYEGLLDGSRVCVRRPRIDAEESRSTKGVRYRSHRLSLLAFLTLPTDLPLRGSRMEAFDTPKHHSPPRHHSRTPPTHFRLDFWGETRAIYRRRPGHGPARSCWCPRSPAPDNTYTIPSYLVSLMA